MSYLISTVACANRSSVSGPNDLRLVAACTTSWRREGSVVLWRGSTAVEWDRMEREGDEVRETSKERETLLTCERCECDNKVKGLL